MCAKCCIMPEFRENKLEFRNISLHLSVLFYPSFSLKHHIFIQLFIYTSGCLRDPDVNVNIYCQSLTWETLLVVIPNHGFPLFYRPIQSLAQKEQLLS